VTPRARASTYPQIEAFFGGYLHQDFVEEHGDLAGAVAAFARDANAQERRALAREWRAFRQDQRRATTLAATRSAVGRLGAAWAPRRKADLAELDRLASAPLAPAVPELGSALRELRNLRATRALAQPRPAGGGAGQ